MIQKVDQLFGIGVGHLTVQKEKAPNSKRKSLVWITPLMLDVHVHKTSRIEILSHLAKLDYTVYLIGVRSKGKFVSKNQDLKVVQIPLCYVPLGSPIFLALATLVFLPLYIVRIRPDFVIVEPSMATLGLIWKPFLSKLLKLKAVLDIRSTPVDASGLRGYMKKFEFNSSIWVAETILDGVTIITSAMKNEVSQKFNLDLKPVGIWSDAASIELFNYEKNVDFGLKLREKFGLTGKFIVFYHGQLSLARGILECVDAVSRVKKEYPDIVLFLLGYATKETLGIINDRIHENGTEGRVIVHGSVNYEDVPKYIAMSDVGLVPLPNLPIWRNQCPLKLLEYLAMKKTTIVTDIPANREILGDRQCGIYVSSCDPAKIARAMEFAFNNRDKLEKWGELGQTIVVQKYNWDKAAKDLETFLLKVGNRVD